MRTEANRLKVLAVSTRAAMKNLELSTVPDFADHDMADRRNALESLNEIADQLDEAADALAAVETTGATLGASDAQIAEAKAALVGEGPSDGEMLEWVCDRLIEKRATVTGGVAVRWADMYMEYDWTYGEDTRDAIRKAMAEDAASERASEANHG